MAYLPSYVTIWGKDRQGALREVRKELSFIQGMSLAHQSHDTEGMEGQGAMVTLASQGSP